MITARHFGQRLALLRRNAHLSQEALAEKADLSRNFIGLLEGGQREPSLSTVLRIRRALGVKMSDLVPEELSHRTLQEERAVYGGSPTNPEYERLVRRLQKCSAEEIAAIDKIIEQALKLKRRVKK